MPATANPLFSNRGDEQLRRDPLMNMVWIVLSLTIASIVAKRMTWNDERHAQSHLGFVSHQWLADHRLSQVSDPQR
jgi:hypothetical protein